jgi:hypothetical protein
VGSAVISGDGNIVSAGSDGSLAVVRQQQHSALRVISRLERRLQCAGAKVEGLKGSREREVFLANGADSGHG